MELAWIEDFLALARTLNFTQASLQRNTTQPAFSRRVQLLEEWLGTQLFDRSARPIKLTPPGQEFLSRAQRIKEDMLDARRISMSSKSYYPHALRLYATTAIAVGILPEWISRQEHNHFSILTSSTAGCLEALRQKRADYIFLPWFVHNVQDVQLTYEKIVDDNLVLVEAPNAQSPLAFTNKCLSGRLLMHAPGTIFGQEIARHLASQDIQMSNDIVCESSSTEVLLAFARKGIGAAWLPQSLIAPDVKRCAVIPQLDVPCTVMMVSRSD